MKKLYLLLLLIGTVLGTLTSASGYRDLETGTFITRDPAGFVDGPNVYTYVRQNPWSAFDPQGLQMMHAGGSELLETINDPYGRGDGGDVVKKGAAAMDREMADAGKAAVKAVTSTGSEVVLGAAPGGPVLKAGNKVRKSTKSKNVFSRLTEWFGNTFGKGKSKGGANPSGSAQKAGEESAEAASEAASSLTPGQSRSAQKIDNAVRDHMTDSDLSGAVADQVGAPIPKPGGGYWDHTKEMNDTLRGLRKNSKKLEGASDEAAKAARVKASDAIEKAEDAIKGAGI